MVSCYSAAAPAQLLDFTLPCIWPQYGPHLGQRQLAERLDGVLPQRRGARHRHRQRPATWQLAACDPALPHSLASERWCVTGPSASQSGPKCISSAVRGATADSLPTQLPLSHTAWPVSAAPVCRTRPALVLQATDWEVHLCSKNRQARLQGEGGGRGAAAQNGRHLFCLCVKEQAEGVAANACAQWD